MGLTDEILCRALLPSLGWKEGLSVSGDCSSFVCFACVCLCMYVCIYVCFYVCLCVHSPVFDPCQHFFISERGHIFETSLLPLNTYTCQTHDTFHFFFLLLLKTARLVKARPFSKTTPFRSCLNSPPPLSSNSWLLFGYKNHYLFWTFPLWAQRISSTHC